MEALKRVWSITKDRYRSIKWFVKNIFTYKKTLLNSRPWDYEGVFFAIEDHLRSQIKGGMKGHVGGDRHISQMKVMVELSKRIREDCYAVDKFMWQPLEFGEPCPLGTREVIFSDPIKKFDLPTKSLAFKTDLRKQDLEMLTKIMNKHILSWWD